MLRRGAACGQRRDRRVGAIWRPRSRPRATGVGRCGGLGFGKSKLTVGGRWSCGERNPGAWEGFGRHLRQTSLWSIQDFALQDQNFPLPAKRVTLGACAEPGKSTVKRARVGVPFIVANDKKMTIEIVWCVSGRLGPNREPSLHIESGPYACRN